MMRFKRMFFRLKCILLFSVPSGWAFSGVASIKKDAYRLLRNENLSVVSCVELYCCYDTGYIFDSIDDFSECSDGGYK